MLGLITAISPGSMPEWLMGADCKSAGYAYAGSNPARPTLEYHYEVEAKLTRFSFTSLFFARVAQW